MQNIYKIKEKPNNGSVFSIQFIRINYKVLVGMWICSSVSTSTQSILTPNVCKPKDHNNRMDRMGSLAYKNEKDDLVAN